MWSSRFAGLRQGFRPSVVNIFRSRVGVMSRWRTRSEFHCVLCQFNVTTRATCDGCLQQFVFFYFRWSEATKVVTCFWLSQFLSAGLLQNYKRSLTKIRNLWKQVIKFWRRFGFCCGFLPSGDLKTVLGKSFCSYGVSAIFLGALKYQIASRFMCAYHVTFSFFW